MADSLDFLFLSLQHFIFICKPTFLMHYLIKQVCHFEYALSPHLNRHRGVPYRVGRKKLLLVILIGQFKGVINEMLIKELQSLPHIKTEHEIVCQIFYEQIQEVIRYYLDSSYASTKRFLIVFKRTIEPNQLTCTTVSLIFILSTMVINKPLKLLITSPKFSLFKDFHLLLLHYDKKVQRETARKVLFAKCRLMKFCCKVEGCWKKTSMNEAIFQISSSHLNGEAVVLLKLTFWKTNTFLRLLQRLESEDLNLFYVAQLKAETSFENGDYKYILRLSFATTPFHKNLKHKSVLLMVIASPKYNISSLTKAHSLLEFVGTHNELLNDCVPPTACQMRLLSIETALEVCNPKKEAIKYLWNDFFIGSLSSRHLLSFTRDSRFYET
ncbi:hypothetical protein EGR_00503 [Echinococcus granulosus]|uniref:Uncharacterized protein n=1 Tax=Echinococcus granulosus TaxID=6210 RepID=W6UTE9_ECHGR|nr:hypothetical protein EGR_00503 [Echinococcus granulosus]EUB64553.1 hypothetical protein EGR_00503 [Echinococcus granulosus]